jgi:hypothetical protein
MAIGNNAAILAAELEKVHSADLEKLFQFDSVFWSLIKARPKDTVSVRPERIVYKVSNGAKSRAVNLEAGDMGRGGAPQYVFGSVAPVSYDWIIEWTKLADIATDNRQKAVVDYMSEILASHSETAAFNLDSLLSYGDGSNTLGIVTSYDNTNFIVYVDNATRFYVNQDVDLYSALGTASLTTFTITGIDPNAKALYLAGAPGSAPVANYLLLENNSAGTAASGLNGILAYQVNSATGYYTGVSRAANPGVFSTPTVNAGGATLTPALARLLLNQLKIARGVTTKMGNNVKLHTGLDQQAAWENTGINVTQNIQGANATARDMLAPDQVATLAGIPFLVNLKAIPGRIDLLDFSTYYRTEVQPLDMYSVGGQKVFWPMGASGGIVAAQMSYMIWMGNVVCENPRANAFISNLAVPSGY